MFRIALTLGCFLWLRDAQGHGGLWSSSSDRDSGIFQVVKTQNSGSLHSVKLGFPETPEKTWGQAHLLNLLSYPVRLAVEPQHQDWLAVILGPAISVPFATCYAALICSDASLRSHFPMVLQHLDCDFFSDWLTNFKNNARCLLAYLSRTVRPVCHIEPCSSASA